MKKKIILIAGPTASGKSKLALNIAKKINGEIINADSMQVYKEFNILSSRPNNQELKKIKHHLYGFISVKDYFSTGEWLKLVKRKIISLSKKNKIPILVGGTGLYFNAITKGISQIPEIDLKTRNFVRNLHKKIGQKKFYNKLINIDSLAINKVSPLDVQRTIRTYEVKLATKISLYEWAKSTKSEFSDYDIKNFFLDIPRDILLKNIYRRTENMFKNDCIREVEKFLFLNVNKSLSANKLIGVKEIALYLRGISTLDKSKELINIKTRQYAKRQNTWARGHMKIWKKYYHKDSAVLAKKILKVIS